MVVKHRYPMWSGGGVGEGRYRRSRKGGVTRHLAEKKNPIEQLKRGCFALLARHNETACGRRVYTPSSESCRVWERRKKWEGR